MWRLEKFFRFEAAHHLPSHRGKCQRLHGHSWRGVVIVESAKLCESGSEASMVVDYTRISDILHPIIENYLDHHYLNDTLSLENPTSEEISRWLFNAIRPQLPGLVAVRIEETCTSSCEYQPPRTEK